MTALKGFLSHRSWRNINNADHNNNSNVNLLHNEVCCKIHWLGVWVGPRAMTSNSEFNWNLYAITVKKTDQATVRPQVNPQLSKQGQNCWHEKANIGHQQFHEICNDHIIWLNGRVNNATGLKQLTLRHQQWVYMKLTAYCRATVVHGRNSFSTISREFLRKNLVH